MLFVLLVLYLGAGIACAPGRSAATSASTANQPTGLTAEERAAFAWFDGLGFPSLKGCKFVRVARGEWQIIDNGPEENTFVRGWLLNAADGTFTICDEELFVKSFRWKLADDVPDYEKVGYKVLDLRQEAAELLGLLRGKDARSRFLLDRRMDFRRLDSRAIVFVFARGCAANGLETEAHELCSQILSNMTRPDEAAHANPLFPAMENSIGHAVMWRAIEAFGDARITRTQLLERFRGFVRDYPDGLALLPPVRDRLPGGHGPPGGRRSVKMLDLFGTILETVQ